MLEVRVSTIQRRCREFGLSDEFDRYSDITDDELDQIHASVTGNSREGQLTPNVGRRSCGLRIQRWRVSECLRCVDPIGTALRWRMTIYRRCHNVSVQVQTASLLQTWSKQCPSQNFSSCSLLSISAGNMLII